VLKIEIFHLNKTWLYLTECDIYWYFIWNNLKLGGIFPRTHLKFLRGAHLLRVFFENFTGAFIWYCRKRIWQTLG
jgi:hypothetical protein